MPGLKNEPDHHDAPVRRNDRNIHDLLRTVYGLLASVKLALALLIAILACCVTGAAIIRNDERSWELIFSTLWFNGLLVLLIVNVGFCFFGRIWGRRVTLVSFGMILFHLSFIAIFAGVVYNSLFSFHGLIRLTEGETLPTGDIRSYDATNRGRLFDITKLKGETTLIKMHASYRVDGANKRAAYEIAVGEGGDKKQGVIYITKSLEHQGVRYLNDREGYSLLITLRDRTGQELYGAYIPLQSLKQGTDSYLYTTGTRTGAGIFPYPQQPLQPLYALQVAYLPSPFTERGGDAAFQVWPYREAGPKQREKPLAAGKAPIGGRFPAGDHALTAAEVRYWVMMSVRYDPGKPIVLASLWAVLGGMIITFIGRIRRGSA